MADDHRFLLAERVEQADEVAEQVELRILLHRRRAVGLAVAAQVGSDGVVAGRGQGGELKAPGVPRLREAVQQHHQRTFALFGDVRLDAVGLYEPVGDLARHALARRRLLAAHGAPSFSVT